MIENKCGYANKDHTCGYNRVCTAKECDYHSSNYMNVYKRAIMQIEIGLSLLKELQDG